MQTPVLLQESKKLTHIRIIDEDYFDVDFNFEGISIDPKAIYIKRKHFKDINPKALNPENALNTCISQEQTRKSLQQEPRYRAFVDKKPKAKTNSLSYLLPGLSEAKLKAASGLLIPAVQEKDLYFKLLKEDRLDMLEIYLALTR